MMAQHHLNALNDLNLLARCPLNDLNTLNDLNLLARCPLERFERIERLKHLSPLEENGDGGARVAGEMVAG